MANATGPIGTLPGSSHHRVPQGQTCDEHPERLAVKRVQGETDSFGSEQIDMCEECFVRFQKEREKELENKSTVPHYCEYGNHMALNVAQRRDPEEGSAGRLYSMCSACHTKMVDAFVGDDQPSPPYYFDD